jgi:uncharacterized protein DUF551
MAKEKAVSEASPREFKPYMEDHEYYDPPQASPTGISAGQKQCNSIGLGRIWRPVVADSEVRQSEALHEAWTELLLSDRAVGGWHDRTVFSAGFEAGMRAGEIARWIPVEEKLPEITSHWGPGDFYGGSDEVLAYNGHICTAVRYKSGTWGSADEGSKLTGVTHWQPLPAAPEENK